MMNVCEVWLTKSCYINASKSFFVKVQNETTYAVFSLQGAVLKLERDGQKVQAVACVRQQIHLIGRQLLFQLCLEPARGEDGVLSLQTIKKIYINEKSQIDL